MGFFNSMKSLFNDTSVCPPTTNQTIIDARVAMFDPEQSPYFAYCQSIPATLTPPTQCQLGITNDTQNLGFSVAGDAVAYCSAATTGTDPACPAFLDAYLTAVVKSLGPVSDWPWILSGAGFGGMILIFILFSLWIRITRWTKASTMAYQPESFSSFPDKEQEELEKSLGGEKRYQNQKLVGYTGTVARGTGNEIRVEPKSGPKSRNNGGGGGPGGERMSFFSSVRASFAGYQNLKEDRAPPMPKGGRDTFDPNTLSVMMDGGVSSGGQVQMKVIEDYPAQLEDELALRRGDIITVLEMFDDGWSVARNDSTGESGATPLACLAPLDYQDRSRGGRRSVVGGRVSSLYMGR
jgi:hypothetical protein